ncbi:O-antigen polymerase [Pedobacter frigiditerrae]|uniref:O-antigen polymerase n=1 Tax=Pedobacter frigiditerrae TaxID=2530452 RepID=UPI00292D5E7C|nr:O-antigen polymerase [Pedobacter frigiditerrae]
MLKFKSILNPVTIYSVFVFFMGYSYLPISNDQHKSYYWLTELIFFSSVFSFLAGCFFHRSDPRRFKLPKFTLPMLKILFMLTVILGILIFLLEIVKIGYMPILNLGGGLDVYSEANENLIPFGHYLVLFMALMPSIAYTFWKLKRINFLIFIVVSIIGFFIIVNFLSRQTILLLLLSLFFSYSYFTKVSNMKIILMGLAAVAMFIFVGNLRADSSDVEIVNESLKSYANIDKSVHLSETYVTLYSSKNFTTFDDLVIKTINNSNYGYGIYTLKPIISLLFLDRLGLVYYDSNYDGFTRLGTYMIEPFSDFHIIGAILFNFLIGYLAMNTFKSFYRKANTSSIVNYSLVVYCMIMAPFTNFYLSFFIWFSILLNALLTNSNLEKKPDSL